MAIKWQGYGDMKKAVELLPKGSSQYADYAIPDVYGKALQLYFSLYDSHSRLTYHMEAVQLWRGLITMLALQDFLNLPLSWEKVYMPDVPAGAGGNLFGQALRRPPNNAERMLFDEPGRWWNGRDFYVLKWTPPAQNEIDLMLYSPCTLVYPTADWRSNFSGLREIKWFDRRTKCFCSPETALNEQEKKIVYFWLTKLRKDFDLERANEAQRTIKGQLDQYAADLQVYLENENAFARYRLAEIGGAGAGPADLYEQLRMTVKAVLPEVTTDKGKPADVRNAFSDQICYFEMADNENPFENFRYAQNYRVKGRRNCYAFLPVHPGVRESCLASGIAANISMQWVDQAGTACICAALSIAGNTYERKYRVSDKVTAEPGTAVPYMPGHTGKDSFPLISVWPNKIGEAWKKYYVMLESGDCDSSKLQVAEQTGTERGSNTYVTRTPYAPGVIPIVRKLNHNGGTVSVGIVTPRGEPPRDNPAQVKAEVAVDFGTSSTRVFARFDDRIEEVNILTDEPLVECGTSSQSAGLMSDYFVAPGSVKARETLFSVFRKYGLPLGKVQPVLDGVIFQPGPSKMIEMEKSSSDMLSNLKWDIQNSRAYYLAFMKQLTLHISILLYEKGVTSINWKYALPENMSHDDQQEVEKIWRGELMKYLEGVSDKISHALAGNLTESEAASRYFLSRETTPIFAKKGYLVVDIGGGSTDIALWQGNSSSIHMVWHTSVNVAGRRMFTRWIEKYIQPLCAGTNDDNIKKQADMLEHCNPEVKSTIVEIILNANYDKLLESYRFARRKNEGWSMELCSHVNKAVSLLMFAMGYQVGALMKEGSFDICEGSGAFSIAFGGRGSKIMEWRGYDEKSSGKFFAAGMMLAAEREKVPYAAIQVSANPKCEVARGLLEEGPAGIQSVPAPPPVILETEKYKLAARKFTTVFNDVFKGTKTESGLPKLENLSWTHLIAKIEGRKVKEDQVMQIFMESIYNNLDP